MAEEQEPAAGDLNLLHRASRKLHGYLLHTWIVHVLTLISRNRQRWIESGLVEPDGEPNPRLERPYLFDVDALDLEKITYLLGFYTYILSSHKKANFFLMQRDEAKRVLYLKGFDYEGAARASGNLAIGFSSMDTVAFSSRLGSHLRPECEIFTVLAPKDLHWETVDAQRFFRGDYDGLIRFSSEPIRSLYLNARYWQEDITDLVDRTDYFIVYVSSMTESALWEIELLKQRQRTGDTTIVFDEHAIGNKVVQIGTQHRMKELFGDDMLWAKDERATRPYTAGELRDSLSKSFLVVSPDEFFADISLHKERIAKAEGPFGPGKREAPLPFRFFPAVEDESLRELQQLDESIDLWIRERISSKTITSVPWFVNQVQLKILTSLMFGRHDLAGRALAVYSAVMDGTRKLFGPRTAEEREEEWERRAIETLENHAAMAEYIGFTLLAYGKSDEFGDYVAQARQVYDETVAAASTAVEHAFRKG